MPNSNSERLAAAATLLRPLLNDLVFVGGCVTEVLATDELQGTARPTEDVDAIAEITTYAANTIFSERLRACGFAEDIREGAPLCRWICSEVVLDVMPLDEKVLGFSNLIAGIVRRWKPCQPPHFGRVEHPGHHHAILSGD